MSLDRLGGDILHPVCSGWLSELFTSRSSDPKLCVGGRERDRMGCKFATPEICKRRAKARDEGEDAAPMITSASFGFATRPDLTASTWTRL